MRVRLILAAVFILCGTSAFPADNDYNWFWMFYENGRTEYGNLFTVRPFYQKSELENPAVTFKSSIMPLVFWRYENSKSSETYMFFGLFNSINFKRTGIESDYDLSLFPFLYYGSSTEIKDNYLLLWPLGGTMKGKFAHEKITAWVFPGVLLFYFYPPSGVFTLTTAFYMLGSFIPVYSTFDDKEYRGRAFFWPLIKYGSSPSRSDFRILPFYSHTRKKGWYETYSYMMLVNYQEQYFAKDTRYTFFVFPFYGSKRSDSGRISSTTILWPFFSWGYDKANRDYQYNLPWPLVQIRDSENPSLTKRIFFPFYGYYSYSGDEMKFVTPLYFNLKKNSERFSSDYYTIALIWWYYKKDFSVPDVRYGTSWRYYKLWPLFSYEYDQAGGMSFNFLSLLPFRDEEGYEAMYGPFWTLFEYKRFASGERRTGFLMRTYFQRTGKNIFDMSIPILITYKSRGDNNTELSLLAGLFKHIKTESGRRIRILLVPVYSSDKKLTGSAPYNNIDDVQESAEKVRREPHRDYPALTGSPAADVKYSFRF